MGPHRRPDPAARPAPIEWLAVGLGLALVWKYAWVLDDAFVYFRYLDNALYLGFGLVNNAGEYVEGYSSPAWLLLLGALRALGLSYWNAVVGFGLVAFALFAAALMRLGRRLSPPVAAAGAPVVNLPLCVLSANYAVASYFTSGTESPLVQLAAVATALFVLAPSSRLLQLALAVTPLVRHELALPLLLCTAFAWRRLGRMPVVLVSATFVLVGAWLGFRIVYYADLLPNTFYLKDAVDLDQGWLYLGDTVFTYRLDILLALGLTALWLLRRSQGPRADLYLGERAFMLLLATSVAAYVVKIGGDPRHYRYLAYPVVLAVCALGGVAEGVLARLAASDRIRWRAAVGLGGALMLVSGALHPAQLSAHPLLGEPEHTTTHQIADAELHRSNPYLVPAARQSGAEFDPRERYPGLPGHGPEAYRRVAVGAACFKHYLELDARALNFYGLTDAFLARTDVPYSRPAHKQALHPLALDLAGLIEAGVRPARGMARQAMERGIAPRWMVENLPVVEAIERKAYNRHDLFENLRLAFTPTGRIDPGLVRRRGEVRGRAPGQAGAP